MTFSNGDVVTVMTLTGEFVGKLKGVDGANVTLEDPRFVTATEQGMGFAGGIAMTGDADPKEVELFNVAFITQTNPQVESAYRSAVSGIIQPTKGGLVV